MRASNRLLLICGVFALALFASSRWPTRKKPPDVSVVSGRVFEVTNPDEPRRAWNLIPLADAEILVVWHAEVDVFVDSQRVCVASARTTSRADGTFSLLTPKLKQAHAKAASYAYKEGYRDVSVVSTPDEFATTADHVWIMRNAVQMSASPPSRAEVFVAEERCPRPG